MDVIQCECGCGTWIDKINQWGRPKRFVSGHNGRGRRNWRYVGGLTLGSDGYVLINICGKRYRFHRMVYEAYHRCCLLPTTVIHHKNINPLDNSINNLEALLNTREHISRFHKTPKSIPINRECIRCGAQKSRPNRYGVPNWFKNGDGYICNRCYRSDYMKKWRKKKLRSLGYST